MINKKLLLTLAGCLSLFTVFSQNVSIGTPTVYGTSYDIAITLTSSTAINEWELRFEQTNGTVTGISYIQIAGATVSTSPYVELNGNQITVNNTGLGYGAIAARGSVVVNCRILSTEAAPVVNWVHFPSATNTNNGGSAARKIPFNEIWSNGGYDNFAMLNNEVHVLRIGAKTQIGSFYSGPIPYSLSVLFPESNIISCSEAANTKSVFWAKNYSHAFAFGIGDDNKGHVFHNFNNPSSVMTFDQQNVTIDQGSLRVNGVASFGTTTDPNVGLNVLSTGGTALCVDQTNTQDYGVGIIAKVSNILTKSFVVHNRITDKDVFNVMGDGEIQVRGEDGRINFLVQNTGFVYAREVQVKVGDFPDYVFHEEYDLMPLDSLTEYIKVHKHLPNVPSANQVETNGIGLGELARIQQEKIEELTLYLIEMKMQMEELKKQVQALKQE